MAAGCGLGLDLLAWGSGTDFVAVVAGWIALVPLVGASTAAISAAARAAAIAAVTALGLVVLFQEPGRF